MCKYIRSFLRDQKGVVFVYTGILLPFVVGFSALALDVGSWYKTHQDVQIAADAGAIGGAWDIAHGSLNTVTHSALGDSGKNGFVNGSKNVTVTVNNPPKSGSYTGNANAVEVIVSQQMSSLLSSLFMQNAFSISSRAVAVANTPSNGAATACILALDPSIPDAITMNGNLSANFKNCVIASDSTDNASVFVGGNVNVSAQSIYTAGNITQVGNSTLNLLNPANTGAQPIPDPYTNVQIPVHGACDYNNYSPGNGATLNPGVYCGGLSFQHSATLNPGTYYVTDGSFQASGQSQITCNCHNPGDGVTIVLTGSSPGGVNIEGGAIINLQAPTNAGNLFDGFLFFQDRSTLVGTQVVFNGNSTINMQGTLYFPRGAFRWNGDSSDPNSCTQIVADTLQFTGNTTITDTSCGTQGAGQIAPPAQIVSVNLVE